MNGGRVNTTAGRMLLYDIVPEELGFESVNRVMTKKELKNLIGRCYREAGIKKTVLLADRLKDLGYKFATQAGISICMADMVIPRRKESIIVAAQQEIKQVEEQYNDGLITEGEKYNKVVDIWTRASDEVAAEMMNEVSVDYVENEDGTKEMITGFNSIFMMADSGARGSKDQMRQLAGMRGLMAKPTGEIIEQPITANFREGLTVLQYFVSTHGARKGLADTALKTANSGYLTRRLVDVAQDSIISEKDCGTIDGIWVESLREAGEVIQPLGERVLGRVALEDIRDPYTDEVLIKANQEIDEDAVALIEEAGIDRIRIRSVLTCRSKQGVCVKCYGRDLAHGKEVEIGETIGIIAAQSIGEPGTQLTMRTFHIGGTASRRVEQTQVVARNVGQVKFINLSTVHSRSGELVVMGRKGEIAVISDKGRERERYQIIYGAHLRVVEGQRSLPAPCWRNGTRSPRPSSPKSPFDPFCRHRGRQDHDRKGGPGDRQVQQGHHRIQGHRNPSPDRRGGRGRKGAQERKGHAGPLPAAPQRHHHDRVA
jgi:DNA-directed RNA polymerase subunit beta'